MKDIFIIITIALVLFFRIFDDIQYEFFGNIVNSVEAANLFEINPLNSSYISTTPEPISIMIMGFELLLIARFLRKKKYL